MNLERCIGFAILKRVRATWRSLTCVAMLLLGAGLLAQGLWIPVKAEIAQVLLDRAWQKSAEAAAPSGSQQDTFKPWSWADTWPVARLSLPGAEESLIVLAGATGQALAFGPGLHDNSAKPPAVRHHLVIAGHRDTHFAPLEHLQAGQIVALELPGVEQRTYRVLDTQVAHREEGWLLDENEHGEDELLTLVTCYPFRAWRPGGPMRWIVRAQRVS